MPGGLLKEKPGIASGYSGVTGLPKFRLALILKTETDFLCN